MTKSAWLMVGFLGVIIASFGGFLWIQASRATSLFGIMSGAEGEGYGVLHITYQQADYYQAGAVGAMVLGSFMIIVGLARMMLAK